MNQKEVLAFMEGLPKQEESQYTAYEAEICSQYEGCSDSQYTDVFLRRLWDKLIEEIYNKKESYATVNVLSTNSIGAKVFKYVPVENSNILSLNNDLYCWIASKAILQNKKLAWDAQVRFGSLADYFFMEDNSMIVTRASDLIINTYEESDFYYKMVDSDKSKSDLPYYLYCLVRSAGFLVPKGSICTIIPNKLQPQLEGFSIASYSGKLFERIKLIEDPNYTAYLFTNKS